MKKTLKILVAEDSLEVQEAIKKILGKEFELDIVSTPEEAIGYDKNFDLLLTDFYFGEDKKRGTEIIRYWKEKRKDLSAALMSSGLNSRIIDECNKLDTITFRKYKDNKTPIEEDELMKAIIPCSKNVYKKI